MPTTRKTKTKTMKGGTAPTAAPAPVVTTQDATAATAVPTPPPKSLTSPSSASASTSTSASSSSSSSSSSASYMMYSSPSSSSSSSSLSSLDDGTKNNNNSNNNNNKKKTTKTSQTLKTKKKNVEKNINQGSSSSKEKKNLEKMTTAKEQQQQQQQKKKKRAADPHLLLTTSTTESSTGPESQLPTSTTSSSSTLSSLSTPSTTRSSSSSPPKKAKILKSLTEDCDDDSDSDDDDDDVVFSSSKKDNKAKTNGKTVNKFTFDSDDYDYDSDDDDDDEDGDIVTGSSSSKKKTTTKKKVEARKAPNKTKIVKKSGFDSDDLYNSSSSDDDDSLEQYYKTHLRRSHPKGRVASASAKASAGTRKNGTSTAKGTTVTRKKVNDYDESEEEQASKSGSEFSFDEEESDDDHGDMDDDEDNHDKKATNSSISRRESAYNNSNNNKKKVALESDDEKEDEEDDDLLTNTYDKKLTLSSDDDDGTDDSDDDDDELGLGGPSPFFQKTEIRRREGLDSLKSQEDKALQLLLWDELGFGDTLFPHQCMAVRRGAGVPAKFPLHEGSRCTYQDAASTATATHDMGRYYTHVSIEDACEGIDWSNMERGILIADEMGLGKTIESIAACVLYSALSESRDGKKKPCVIVTPNSAVLEQWIETLARNGVRAKRIRQFQKGTSLADLMHSDSFILLERSKLQSELKTAFDWIASFSKEMKGKLKKKETTNKKSPSKRTTTPKKKTKGNIEISPLWPSVNENVLEELFLHQMVSKGQIKKEELDFEESETNADRLSREMEIQLSSSRRERVFRMFIIDEAHFLKNNIAFWGIASQLVGIHSDRVLPLTGTPYANSHNDLAAIMGYIDPRLDFSKTAFWRQATSHGAPIRVREAIKDWTGQFLVRRTKEEVLKNIWTIEKHMNNVEVEQHPCEISIQKFYEAAVKRTLMDFAKYVDAVTLPAMENKKRIFTVLMSLISCARAAAIHPLIPGGREFTIQFSPTRRQLKQAEKKICCACNSSYRPSIPVDPKKRKNEKKAAVAVAGHTHNEMDLDDDDLDDEAFDGTVEELDNDDDPFVPLPCCERVFGLQHFIHKKCLLGMDDISACPRCADGQQRAQLNLTASADDLSTFESKTYCRHVNGGFVGSSKINKIIEWVQAIDKNDKMIIVSFYKGALDLLEGILSEMPGMDYARFDGDFNQAISKEQLNRFKKNPNVRVLLATVQSGGTGLNLVEANHIFFADRWFNPFVHDQAADRAYRLGQKKDVNVNFFDCCLSIDDVMAILNKYKSRNAKVILPDGTDLGTNGGGISYQEMSGLLSRAMNGIVTAREDHIQENGSDVAIPRASGDLVDSILQDSLVHGRTAAQHEQAIQRFIQTKKEENPNPKKEENAE